MITSLSTEIRDRLVQYLARDITLREFQEWFVPTTWNLDESTDSSAADLAADIELRLAEYTGGHLDEAEVRAAFALLVSRYTSGPRTRTQIGSSNVSIVRRLAAAFPSESADGTPPRVAAFV